MTLKCSFGRRGILEAATRRFFTLAGVREPPLLLPLGVLAGCSLSAGRHFWEDLRLVNADCQPAH